MKNPQIPWNQISLWLMAKFSHEIHGQNPHSKSRCQKIPISMGPLGPRAVGSSPLFATRWKRRPAMHGSPGSRKSMGHGRHGQLEIPSINGAVEWEKSWEHHGRTSHWSWIAWAFARFELLFIHGALAQWEKLNRKFWKLSTHYRSWLPEGIQKESKRYGKAKGKPNILHDQMVNFHGFVHVDVNLRAGEGVKESMGRKQIRWWMILIFYLQDIPLPIWVKFWNANFRWLRNPKFSWSNGQSCEMLILTFWESTCFPY